MGTGELAGDGVRYLVECHVWGDRPTEFVDGTHQASLKQAFLGREVATDERDVDAGVVGDMPHGGGGVAVAGETASSGVEQELPGARRVTPTWAGRQVTGPGRVGCRRLGRTYRHGFLSFRDQGSGQKVMM
jgi:hypothetical protein